MSLAKQNLLLHPYITSAYFLTEPDFRDLFSNEALMYNSTKNSCVATGVAATTNSNKTLHLIFFYTVQIFWTSFDEVSLLVMFEYLVACFTLQYHLFSQESLQGVRDRASLFLLSLHDVNCLRRRACLC